MTLEEQRKMLVADGDIERACDRMAAGFGHERSKSAAKRVEEELAK